MSLPVHTTSQGWIVAYANTWASTTLQPFPGDSWLTIDEARACYESNPSRLFFIVEAFDHEQDRLTRARWSVTVTRGRSARVEFFNAAGSMLTSMDYVDHDGRLFVSQRFDYEYPDTVREYSRSSVVKMVASVFKVDGRGSFRVEDKRTGETMRTAFKDADFSTLWFEWPSFGDWDVFANFDHGILPLDFAMTPL